MLLLTSCNIYSIEKREDKYMHCLTALEIASVLKDWKSKLKYEHESPFVEAVVLSDANILGFGGGLLIDPERHCFHQS